MNTNTRTVSDLKMLWKTGAWYLVQASVCTVASSVANVAELGRNVNDKLVTLVGEQAGRLHTVCENRMQESRVEKCDLAIARAE